MIPAPTGKDGRERRQGEREDWEREKDEDKNLQRAEKNEAVQCYFLELLDAS